MVIGGRHLESEILDDVELVTLDLADNAVPPCLEGIAPLPIPTYGSAGSVGEDGLPFVCGGRILDSCPQNPPAQGCYTDQCFKYLPQNDEWVQVGRMPEERAFSATADVEGLGLVIVGGQTGEESGHPDSNVLATKDGQSFQVLADLPVSSTHRGTIQKQSFFSYQFSKIRSQPCYIWCSSEYFFFLSIKILSLNNEL